MNKKYDEYLSKLPKGIYVESKAVSGTNDAFQHLSLTYSDGNGNLKVIRGQAGDGGAIDFGKSFLGENIEVESGVDYEKSNDYYGKLGDNKVVETVKLDIKEKDIDKTWNSFVKSADKIHKSEHNYNSLWNVQNSNSVVNTILTDHGVDVKKIMPDHIIDKSLGVDTLLHDKSNKKQDYRPEVSGEKKLYEFMDETRRKHKGDYEYDTEGKIDEVTKALADTVEVDATGRTKSDAGMCYVWEAEGMDSCDKCKALDGKVFTSMNEIPDKPHPNCNCTIKKING